MNKKKSGGEIPLDKKVMCDWKQDTDTEYNLWETDCGEMFCLEDGTPKDNKMNYCCYCGRKLKST